MNFRKNIDRYAFLIILVLLMVIGILTPLFGGPGDSSDPVVSLSYLQLATRYGEIPLRKGEELPIPNGSSFILLDGDIELKGIGDYVMVDLTIGKSFKKGKEISGSHLYVVAGGNDLKLVAKKDSKILIPGGNAGPLRKAQ